MGKKMVAMFLMCMVIVAVVQMSNVKAAGDVYNSCFKKCDQECKEDGKGETVCEMKCDEDCEAAHAKEMLGIHD